MLLGALEAGGTKMVCAIGDETGKIMDRISIPTETPEITMPKLIEFFKKYELAAIGIGTFGPADLNPKSETYGHIMATPKLAWKDYDIRGEFERALNIPVGFDTDVNAACLGEATFGCMQDVDTGIYITIGTGVGVGTMVNRKLLHGMLHPEGGHILLEKNPKDTYKGKCPFHSNCMEGLAAGPAIEGRYGKKAFDLKDVPEVWELEAEYIAKALEHFAIRYVDELMDYSDVEKYVNIVSKRNDFLVENLIPDYVSMSDLKFILTSLIREKVSIKDIILIFERLCDFARFNKDPNVLNERLRSELGAAICLSHSVLEKDANKPTLYALTLSNAYEKLLEKSVQYTEIGVMFMLKPAQVEKLIKAVDEALLATKKHSDNVVLLVSPRIRLPLFGLLSRHFENIKVLSFSELITDINVECIGEIK